MWFGQFAGVDEDDDAACKGRRVRQTGDDFKDAEGFGASAELAKRQCSSGT
jgi:hypothetical protein